MLNSEQITVAYNLYQIMIIDLTAFPFLVS